MSLGITSAQNDYLIIMKKNTSQKLDNKMNDNQKWLTVLKQKCDEHTQTSVAKEMGYSPAVINQVLKGCYKGDKEKVKEIVEGKYMNKKVDCPAIGKISVDLCVGYRGREFKATNPLRVQLYKTCPTCENNGAS